MVNVWLVQMNGECYNYFINAIIINVQGVI